MMRTIGLVAVLLASTACSTIRGDETETNFGSTHAVASTPVAVSDETADEQTISVGESSVADDGAASEAIDFVSAELYSGSDIGGRDLLGDGGVIATFVQPGCELASDHAALLAAAASSGDAVTFVFVHSGGNRDSFVDFAAAAGLDRAGIVHLDDANGELSHRFGVESYPSTLLVDGAGRLSSTHGALDATRLDRALAIVASS